MPRRNAVTRPRNGQRSRDDEQHDNRRVSTEQMARNLVDRGLASRAILDPSKDER